MESKLALYNRMQSQRDEMKEEEVADLSFKVQRRALMMEEIRTALRIGLYAAYKNEIRTDLVFQEGDKHRKEIYFPAVDTQAGGLSYFRVLRLEDLRLSEDGFKEPTAKQSRLRDINTLNVLIVPGVAFDLKGSRMGFGKNFYDDCLTKFRGVRVAFAYDFQIVPDLPLGVKGRKLDWIVTESRVIRC